VHSSTTPRVVTAEHQLPTNRLICTAAIMVVGVAARVYKL